MTSQTNLQQAALVATAVASALGNAQGAPMTPNTAASILGSAIQAAGPLIDPRIGIAVSLATLALSAIHVATQSGQGMTHEELAKLFSADDAAIAADDAARKAAGA